MPKPLTGLSEQHKEKKRSQVDSERKESSETLLLKLEENDKENSQSGHSR